jgi:hypothetical protein
MIIDGTKWQQIIDTTKASIEWWNATASRHGMKDTFECETHILPPHGAGVVVATTLRSQLFSRDNIVKQHAIFVTADGVRPAKIQRNKDHIITGFKFKPVPKAWATLADKSAEDIVSKTKLVDFFLVTGSSLPYSVSN